MEKVLMAKVLVSPFPCCSLLPLSLPRTISSLSLIPSKHRPPQTHNHFIFSTSQSQCRDHHQSLFTTTNFLPYDLVDLFDTLRASVHLGDVDLAESVHCCVLKLGEDSLFSAALLSAYLKLGFFSEARKVFLGLSHPDLVAYTALISGFSKSKREYEAIELFMKMRTSGIEPNEFGFVAILTACIRVLEVQLGLQVHALAIKTGFLGCSFVANALMSLYMKSGHFQFVAKLFDEMPQRDLSSWNIAMSSAVKEGMYGKALELFSRIRGSDIGFEVDSFTISTILCACGLSGDREEGRKAHALTIKRGLERNLSVGNALIGFYNKCGCSVEDVNALFDDMPIRDTITWTEMITAYMDFGFVGPALEVFKRMPERNSYAYNSLLAGFCKNGQGSRALHFFIGMISECLELTDFTLSSAVSACGLLGDSNISQQIHGFIIKSGCGSNSFIDSTLIDMYTRCGKMSDAYKMFNQQPKNHNVSVILTSMICGYARNGQLEEAISLFHHSQLEGTMALDEVVLTSVLSLCGSLAFHEMGKQIHCLSIKSGFSTDLELGNSVVSMYAKCWNIVDGVRAFDSMVKHDLVSWNSLIAGHILHRNGDEALSVWSKMQKSGIKPDKVTFTLVISAYRHTDSNLVHHCRSLFYSLKTDYKTEPTSEHIASFVAVLGFWGLLHEAEELINKLSFKPEMIVWRALLDSSRIQSNTGVSIRAANQILSMEPRDPSSYMLVSNLYSASGRWHCSEMVREDMREKGFKKQPGQSWIVHKNRIHSFYARDKSHCQSRDIYSGLEILIRECLRAGYVPDLSYVLHEVEEHQKSNFLFYHSAKLAAAYGILMAEPGKPIRVAKNIALCGDCHEFLKYVSIVTCRDIFLRDSSGFHCFSRGKCSCKDYW